MVDRQTRVKKKKFRKTPGAKTSTNYSRAKKTKAKCLVTGKTLAGTGNQIKSSSRQKAKSKRRPSVAFGGILSGEARKNLWEEFALIESGKKKIGEVPIKIRKLIAGKVKQ